MSVAIEHVTIGGADDGRLVLGNAQFGAYLVNISSSWNRIRLGMRVSFADVGGTLTGTPYFMVGVMSNPSGSMVNGPLTSNCTNFVGVRSNTAAWGQVSQSVGAPVYYNWVSASGFRCVHRASGSEQIGTTGMGALTPNGRWVSASTGSHRTPVIVEITRVSSPTAFSCSIMLVSGTVYAPDETYVALKNAMEISTFSSVGALTALSGTYFISNGNVVCDESSGSLNSIVVGWNLISAKVHISDFLWTKFDS